MNKTLFIIFLIISNIVFGQSKYNSGFNDGYKKGYCHDKGIGCIEPIPPVAPVPGIGEDLNSYQDGYNRGFKMGLQANSNSSQTATRKRYTTSTPTFVDDFIYNPYKDQNFVDLKMKTISVIMDRAVQNYNDGNYDAVIENANDLIKLQPNFAIAYYLKSISYFKKGQILNSYNFGVKQYQIYNSEARKEWYDQIYKFSESYLKDLLSENRFNDVKYFCENVWTKNNLSNFYLGVSNYYLGDYKKAKKAFKKVKDFSPATKYIQAIDQNKTIPNPY